MVQNRSTLQVENIVVGCRLPRNVRCGYQCQCRGSVLSRRAIDPALKRPEAEPLSVVFEAGTDNGERDQISVAAREHIRSANSRLSEPVIWMPSTAEPITDTCTSSPRGFSAVGAFTGPVGPSKSM